MPELREFVIGVLIMSAVLTGTAIFIGGLTSQYGTSVSNLSYISKAENMTAQLNTTRNAVLSIKTDPSVLDVLYGVAAGAWAAITQIGYAQDFIVTMVSQFSQVIGLPDWVGAFIIALVLAIIVFELLSLASKYKT